MRCTYSPRLSIYLFLFSFFSLTPLPTLSNKAAKIPAGVLRISRRHVSRDFCEPPGHPINARRRGCTYTWRDLALCIMPSGPRSASPYSPAISTYVNWAWFFAVTRFLAESLRDVKHDRRMNFLITYVSEELGADLSLGLRSLFFSSFFLFFLPLLFSRFALFLFIRDRIAVHTGSPTKLHRIALYFSTSCFRLHSLLNFKRILCVVN